MLPTFLHQGRDSALLPKVMPTWIGCFVQTTCWSEKWEGRPSVIPNYINSKLHVDLNVYFSLIYIYIYQQIPWGLLFSGPSKELAEAGSIRKHQQTNMKQQETKQPLNGELALASGTGDMVRWTHCLGDNAGVRVSSARTHFYCTRFVLPASAASASFGLL